MATKRVLTGMRTTGALHLGHYAGALKLWKEIQDTGEYEMFFLLADIQAMTTHDSPELSEKSVRDVTLDWLSVGLDPNLKVAGAVMADVGHIFCKARFQRYL